MFKRHVFLTVVLAGVLLASGCTQQQGRFQLKDLAKSDIDLVADLHRNATLAALKELNAKLYRLNPVQLSKMPNETIESRWQQLLKHQGQAGGFNELAGAGGIAAMRLAFDNNYEGDRIFALMAGLSGMLDEAYGFKSEFYLLDSVDGQKLYNSARNLEVMVWLLRSRKDPRGEPLIYSDSISSELVNLSFERLFGKLIAHQDMMSQIMQGKTQRAVNTVAHGIVSMTFVPL